MNLYYIPVNSRKIPVTPNGEKDAASLEQWDAYRRKGMNLAICTGPSRLLALDRDFYKDIYVKGCVERAMGMQNLPITLAWRTGRGGQVDVFRVPEGIEMPTSRNGVLPGVDIKCRTGYVLAPGSVNAEGGRYELITSMEPVEAPKELLDWLHSLDSKPRTTRVSEELYLTTGMGRWEMIRRHAGMLRRMGWSGDSIYIALQGFVQNQIEADDTVRDEELRRIATFVGNLPPGDVNVQARRCGSCERRAKTGLGDLPDERDDKTVIKVGDKYLTVKKEKK
jgi:hypothetical protein